MLQTGCVPYRIVACGEAVIRVWLQEMFLRHTALHICRYIHKYMYTHKERKKREREREKSRGRERERLSEREREQEIVARRER